MFIVCHLFYHDVKAALGDSVGVKEDFVDDFTETVNVEVWKVREGHGIDWLVDDEDE